MKRLIWALSLVMIVLAACMSAPVTPDVPAMPSDTMPAPTETSVSVIPSDTALAPIEAVSSSKLPAASFETQTYINEEAGFALDYPSGWIVTEVEVGPRGNQVRFLSSPELLEPGLMPEGETSVSSVVYQWDPKNDLAAFVANQKTDWENSGFKVLEEEPLVLELGLSAVRFTVQTPESEVVFLIAALRDQYLVLSGEGNLELVKEILGRVRPISN